MRDAYVLIHTTPLGYTVLCGADDPERLNMEMAKYSAVVQKQLHVVNTTWLEEED